MDKYHITKKGDLWILKMEKSDKILLNSPKKEDLVKKTSTYMKNKKGSVRIHKQDGSIQEERTYPRSADPKGSKG
jgi:hypothetical protein